MADDKQQQTPPPPPPPSQDVKPTATSQAATYSQGSAGTACLITETATLKKE